MFKNRIFSTLFILALLFGSQIYGQDIPPEGINSITSEEMKSHVMFLASDKMRGRNTPSPELDSCAVYIAKEFASYGLQPLDEAGSYFQTFNMLKSRLSEPNSLIVTRNGVEKEYEIKDDFVPLRNTANQKVSGQVVFAGYGITAPEYSYDDYQGVDAEGKIVLVFSDEPQQKDTSSVFLGKRNTKHSRLQTKIKNAIDHGASGLIYVRNPSRRFRRPPNFWPSLMDASSRSAPMSMENKSEEKIVCTQIGKDLLEFLFEGNDKSAKEIYELIDQSLDPQSFEISSTTVTMETNLDAERFPTSNVVGFLEGSDPNLKEEVVVIGAHYDHVGVRNDTIIFNGADDNASGTAGVMEVAEAFSKSPIRPKRSVLFITFAGEEKGLLGSKFYTDNPYIPIINTSAMLNMDMISRNDSNGIAIVGSKSSSDLKGLNEKVNENLGIELDYSQDSFFMQSDHYSFYSKDIPVLFYFAKITKHLHKPTDDPETIDPEKMARVGKLVFSTAWTVANMEGRPNFTKVK